jgi:hypothetical protein
MTGKTTIETAILRCLAFLATIWVCYWVADMADSLRAMRHDIQGIRIQADLFAQRR